MENVPTKTAIKEWVIRKRDLALRGFDDSKTALVYASMLGTEKELDGQEWDACVTKLERLHRKMYKGNKYYSGFHYNKGEYMRTMVRNEVSAVYGPEREAIREEFEKILKNISKIGSPKKMLEYLTACGMQYPAENKETFVPVDASIIQPWLQNQLGAGSGTKTT